MYQGSLIKDRHSLNGDSLSNKAVKIGGVEPSQKVTIQTKFSAISFPNNFKISLKTYR